MKIKVKTYEICNSTNPRHLNVIIKIMKLTKTLGICEIKEPKGNYAMLITKSKKQWSGLYGSRYFWTFEKAKNRSDNGNDNDKPYQKYIQYTFVDRNILYPGPDVGTGGNTSGG